MITHVCFPLAAQFFGAVSIVALRLLFLVLLLSTTKKS